jgi:metal-responsive CopG/Arc/MetJ family transcriptional regulator
MAKISINVPDDVLTQVDEAAHLEDRSRSQWLTRAARLALGGSASPATSSGVQRGSPSPSLTRFAKGYGE